MTGIARNKVHIQVKGAENVIEALSNIRNLDNVRKVVREDTQELKRIMLKNENFVRGYSKGDTERSTSHTMSNNDLTGEVGVTTVYAPFVEKGTSKMKHEEFARPSMVEITPKFKEDIKENIGNKK